MQVEQIYTGSRLRNFSYLVYDRSGQLVVAIDPFDAQQLQKRLDTLGLRLSYIINTHEHADHTCGNLGLLEFYPDLQICVHPDALQKIPGANRALEPGSEIFTSDQSQALRVLHTPGHTMAHISLLLEDNKTARAIFSGDTIFNAGVGNCHNGGDPDTLYTTLSDLLPDLNDDVLLYPGHDYLENNLKFTLEYEAGNTAAGELLGNIMKSSYYPGSVISNLGLERAINTFMRLESPELQTRLIAGASTENARPTARELFLKLRSLRDKW